MMPHVWARAPFLCDQAGSADRPASFLRKPRRWRKSRQVMNGTIVASTVPAASGAVWTGDTDVVCELDEKEHAVAGRHGGVVHRLAGAAHAQETIKIGVLHSLSGTMAISETTL